MVKKYDYLLFIHNRYVSINKRQKKIMYKLINIEKNLKDFNKEINIINSELKYQNNKMTNGFIYMQEEINKSVKYLKDEIENLDNK